MYKVSILIPIYGVERFIERCARSLFEQSYKELEYVFVNDGTLDRSVEVLQQVIEDYPERKSAVRIIKHEKNRGLAAARNTALDNSTGEFVTIVDSDDWLELNAIALLVKRQEETGSDIVSGNRIVHYAQGEISLEEKDFLNKQAFTTQMMQRSWDHLLVGRIFRRTLFSDYQLSWIEGFNLAEDRYMMTLLSYYANHFSKISNVVYHYDKRNEGSITRTVDKKKVLKYNSQELGNVIALERFFNDKEPEYRSECSRCVVDQLNVNMKTALSYSDKDEFYRIVALLDSRSDADLAFVGWKKNGFCAWLQHNYNCMRLEWQINRCVRFVKRVWSALIGNIH